MTTEKTTYEIFESSSEENRRLLRQEELILDVTEAIFEVLEKEGLSQAELAQRLGKSRGHVSRLLNGSRNLTLRTVADLADALGRRVQVEMVKPVRKPARQRNVVKMADWKRRELPLKQGGRSMIDLDLPAVQGMGS